MRLPLPSGCVHCTVSLNSLFFFFFRSCGVIAVGLMGAVETVGVDTLLQTYVRQRSRSIDLCTFSFCVRD